MPGSRCGCAERRKNRGAQRAPFLGLLILEQGNAFKNSKDDIRALDLIKSRTTASAGMMRTTPAVMMCGIGLSPCVPVKDRRAYGQRR